MSTDNYDGSHRLEDFVGVEFVDLPSARVLGRDHWRHPLSAQLGKFAFSADGQAVAGTFARTLPVKDVPNNYYNSPMAGIWDVPSANRRATMERAWICGWLHDDRLVVRTADGECLATDKNLKPTAFVAPTLSDRDTLSVDDGGRHLLIGHIENRPGVLQKVIDRLTGRMSSAVWVEWKCLDLSGNILAEVPGWPGECEVSPDGQFLAVGSPDGSSVDVYPLPPHKPTGFVLALMAAQVALLVAWSAWRQRRRRASRRKPDGVDKQEPSGSRLHARPD